MNDQPTKPASEPKPAAARKKTGHILTRIFVTTVVVLLSLAAIGIAVPWVAYRYRNVVVGEATVNATRTRIGARIEGRIKSIEVEIGQHVSKGQVLLRLDDSHFVAELERCRAQLQSSLSDLESEKLGIEQARRRLTLEIERVKGNRSAAEGALKAEKSNLERFEQIYGATSDLLAKGAAAKMDLVRAAGDRDHSLALIQADQGNVDAQESAYEKAMNELDGLRVRESRLGVLNSAIVAARAQVAAAESDLEATVIRAPEDGLVLERMIETGGSAKVGEPMLMLWTGRAWVEAWTDERDLRKFKIGSPVEISLDSSPSRKLAGRVEAIGLESDKELQPLPVPATLHSFIRLSAMVPVRIALEEDSADLQLGISAIVGIKRESGGLEPARPHVAQASPAAK